MRDLLTAAFSHAERCIADAYPFMTGRLNRAAPWRNDPPTSGQLAHLRRLGMDNAGVQLEKLTKRQASDLIDVQEGSRF